MAQGHPAENGREASALAKAEKSVWELDKFARGNEIEDILGRNLPRTFKTFDKFEEGVATSIKSLDVTAKSYQTGNTLFNKLKGYINEAKNFKNWSMYSSEFGRDVSLDASEITTRVVDLAIQPGKTTLEQWQQIANAINYGQQNGVVVILTTAK